jgi:hypothetical protein
VAQFGLHELAEPLGADLFAEGGDVERQGLRLYVRGVVVVEGGGHSALGDVPEMGLLVFFELLLALEIIRAKCDPRCGKYFSGGVAASE